MSDAEMYGKLAAPFDVIHQLPGRGNSKPLDYINGEQCISRLNEALGYTGWSFEVVEHGINAEADEAWALGRLTVLDQETRTTVKREQFGSQKIKRLRNSGAPVEIGFELKGAATDALKKCATMVGVALYLYERNPERHPADDQEQPSPRNGQAQQAPAAPKAVWTAADAALEAEAQRNRRKTDIAWLTELARIRNVDSGERLQKIADDMPGIIASNPDTAIVFSEGRRLALQHATLDKAAELGHKWPKRDPQSAPRTPVAANPGVQSPGVASGTTSASQAPRNGAERIDRAPADDLPGLDDSDSWPA